MLNQVGTELSLIYFELRMADGSKEDTSGLAEAISSSEGKDFGGFCLTAEGY